MTTSDSQVQDLTTRSGPKALFDLAGQTDAIDRTRLKDKIALNVLHIATEHYSKPQLIEKKNKARAASKASP